MENSAIAVPKRFEDSENDSEETKLQKKYKRGNARIKSINEIWPDGNSFLVALCNTKIQKENPELYDAISHSYKLALTFAKKQRECFYDFETELEEGLFTGQKIIPVERAGLYVPGGTAAYPSTVFV